MRVMDDLIEDNGLKEECEDRMVEETGNTNFWLGSDSELDESSDKEDPEATAKDQLNSLRQESEDTEQFVRALSSTVALRDMATQVERARMELEDMRSYVCR